MSILAADEAHGAMVAHATEVMSDNEAMIELLSILRIMRQRHASCLIYAADRPGNETAVFAAGYYQRKIAALQRALLLFVEASS